MCGQDGNDILISGLGNGVLIGDGNQNTLWGGCQPPTDS
jgi:Ca2+-binding RTX toxin-like protein